MLSEGLMLVRWRWHVKIWDSVTSEGGEYILKGWEKKWRIFLINAFMGSSCENLNSSMAVQGAQWLVKYQMYLMTNNMPVATVYTAFDGSYLWGI